MLTAIEAEAEEERRMIEELYRRAREVAESQHLSVDDVVSSAFAEQLSAWERLKRRAARGSRKSFGRTGQSA